jgi:hypothetical protein
MDGLWTAEFGSSSGIFGGGVAVFRDGKIWGGRRYPDSVKRRFYRIAALLELAETAAQFLRSIQLSVTVDVARQVTIAEEVAGKYSS